MTIEEIINLRSQGYSFAKIGKMVGVSRQRIHQRLEIYKIFKSKRDALREEILNR